MIYPHLEELNRLVAERLVGKQVHPTLPLTIYNYTAKAVTVKQADWCQALCDARGLILDPNGRIVARPFAKFWNIQTIEDRIPVGERFEVWEKLDGSLGIVANYEGHRIVATRGSFVSEQAIWAFGWLDANHPSFIPDSGQTFLFEVIFPQNRIVVDYGDRAEMVLLAVLKTATGQFLDDVFSFTTVFTKARRFEASADHADILKNWSGASDDEGFVLRWPSGLLAKAKKEEYVRLHRLITQCSTRTIWELLRDGKGCQEVLDRVPADFRAWVEGNVETLQSRVVEIKDHAESSFRSAPVGVERKEYAEWAKQQKYPGLLFSLLDGRNIEPAIWKMVEPSWATPFRCGGDL